MRIFPSCRQMNLLPFLFFYLLSPIFGLLDSEPHRVARFNEILSENWSDCDCEGYNEKIRRLTYIAIDKSHHAHVYFFEQLLTLMRRLFQQEEAVINLVEDLANFKWVTVNISTRKFCKSNTTFASVIWIKTSSIAWMQTKHTRYSAPEVINVTAQGHQGAKKLCRKLSA